MTMTMQPLIVATLAWNIGCCLASAHGAAVGGRDPPQNSKGNSSRAETLTELVASLRSDVADDRLRAANSLAKQVTAAEPALNDLIRLLDDADDICVAAVRAICAIGPAAAPAVPAMVKMARQSVAAGHGIPDYN